jgi:hypothetical protein
LAELDDLYKLHRDASEKYIYFLLAAAGASIAFAATQTQAATISWSKLPLAFAAYVGLLVSFPDVGTFSRCPALVNKITNTCG